MFLKVASHPKCEEKRFTIARSFLLLSLFLTKKFEKILFLSEVMDKMVFISLIAFNGMLTSHCDNLSAHHYHFFFFFFMIMLHTILVSTRGVSFTIFARISGFFGSPNLVKRISFSIFTDLFGTKGQLDRFRSFLEDMGAVYDQV